MKKEWMYFIAGAGLAGTIVFYQMNSYSTRAECNLKEMQKLTDVNIKSHVATELVMEHCYNLFK